MVPLVWKQCHQESLLEFAGQDQLDSQRFVLSIRDCIDEIVWKKQFQLYIHSLFLRRQREALGPRLEELACKEVNLPTSDPVDVHSWNHNNEERKVSVLLDRPTAKIHVIDNFASKDECEFIERTRMGQYQHALVADEARGGAKRHGH